LPCFGEIDARRSLGGNVHGFPVRLRAGSLLPTRQRAHNPMQSFPARRG
jgi:hypothetical protein